LYCGAGSSDLWWFRFCHRTIIISLQNDVTVIRVAKEKQGLDLKNELQYRFNDGQIANRFLNELTHWSSSSGNVHVKASLAKTSHTVQISYLFDGRGFDYTCSELDELAARYGGEEV